MDFNRFGIRLNIPYITKHLLIINFIVWLIDIVVGRMGFDLALLFGLPFVTSGHFFIWQPFTYMFMHSGFSHIFFNMFALWMFGSRLEQYWGSKRYLIYYLVTGVGAGIIQELVWWLTGNIYTLTVGASGAIFGLLLAYGWLFPNERMMIFPIPIPIPASIFVLGYAAIELFAGVAGFKGDNVAHFAHLGGMIFGVILILWWKNKGVDTGEGLWDGERMKELWKRVKKWWNRVTNRNQKHQSKTYNNYHYQEPVEEEKQETEAEKAKKAEINRILDKIKMSGYESLTQEEKQTLFRR